MKKALSYAKEFFHRADIFLLVMGLICATFGIIVISSATASYHSAKYVIVQSASLILGVVAFVAMTVLDVDVLADKWQILCAFNVLFLLLLIPFGVSDNTGNTGWLRFFGIGIQPTEVVKLTFIVVLAKQISYLKEYHDLNSVWSVAQLAVHFVLLFGLILFVSSDLGSALIFFSIFLVMLFAAGFALHWFAIGFAAIAAVMGLTGCGYGAKSGYTVRRLRVKESRATLLWGIYHAALLVAFWAALAAAMYIALRLRMGMETPASADSCGPQSMLLLCYTDTFMHHLVPLRDAAMWALGAASVLAVGFGSVLFAYRQRRGQFSILILVAVAATILSFFYGIGSNMLFVLMALQLVLADGAVVSVIRGGNSHEV